MDNEHDNIETIVGEIDVSGFHITAKSNMGTYATGLGRQSIRLHVSDGEVSSFVCEAKLPGGISAVEGFLQKLARNLDTHADETLAELVPALSDKIKLAEGSTWKEWKALRDQHKKPSDGGRTTAA